MLLKNAYAFKDLCEKTDAFLKEYLENLKKANVKEETLPADLGYSTNFLDDISLEQADVGDDNNESDEIKDDPEVQTDEVIGKKDTEYAQVKYYI